MRHGIEQPIFSRGLRHLRAILASRAGANTYYVATDGTDIPSGGTEAQPFRTLNYAAARLYAGDTLLVKPGTYAEALQSAMRPGTSWDNLVTIKAFDPANKPILQPPAGSGRVLHFQSVSAASTSTTSPSTAWCWMPPT